MQVKKNFPLLWMVLLVAFAARAQGLPPDDCTITFSGINEQTGQHRIDINNRLLFTHTEEDLRPFFENQEHITGEAYLSYLSGGYYVLHLHFFVASYNTAQEYNGLEKFSILNLQFMDGQILSLRNSKASVGEYNASRRAIVFKTQYPLSGAALRQLQRGELDKIQVYWKKGYDWYEIYELDFFKEQIECLQTYILQSPGSR